MNKKGFTIIELLIVLAVLGILIGIAIPRISGMRDNANLSKAQKELTTLTSAIESYRTFNPSHTYPPSTTVLQQDYLTGASPQVISNILYDPFAAASTEYNYLCSSNAEYYIIWSVGLTGESQPEAISNSGDVSFE